MHRLTVMPLQSALVKIGLLITCLFCVVGSIQQTISISCGNISHHCNSTKDGWMMWRTSLITYLLTVSLNLVVEPSCDLTHPLIGRRRNTTTGEESRGYISVSHLLHINPQVSKPGMRQVGSQRFASFVGVFITFA